jgi:hypothetical protein
MAHKKTYTLGKGKVLFKPDTAAGAKGPAFVDLGNAPEFSITLETEKLEHYSSRSGIQLKDLSIITQTSVTGTFTLDEPDSENLSMYFMSNETNFDTQTLEALPSIGTAGENVKNEQGVDDTTQATIVIPVDVAGERTSLGQWYPLYDAANAASPDYPRVYQVGADFALYDDVQSGTPNLLVEGGYTNPQVAHYDLDRANGMIYIHDPQPASNPIDTSTALVTLYGFASWVAITGEDSIARNYGFTTTNQAGHFLFAGDPPAGQAMSVLGYGSLTPTGDMAFIGDDWSQFQFEIEFLEHADYQNDSGDQGLIQIINRDQI